jgi:four helix bundle protein
MQNNNLKTAEKRSFRDLLIWQKAHELALGIYRYTRRFPREEENGLTRRFRDTATSIASNIAEGFSTPSGGRKMQMFLNAQSQLESCRYYTVLGRDLAYGNDAEVEDLIEELAIELHDHIRLVRNNVALEF